MGGAIESLVYNTLSQDLTLGVSGTSLSIQPSSWNTNKPLVSSQNPVLDFRWQNNSNSTIRLQSQTSGYLDLTVQGYSYENTTDLDTGLVTLGNRNSTVGRLIGENTFFHIQDASSKQHIVSIQSGSAENDSTLLQVSQFNASNVEAKGSILFMRGTTDRQRREYSVNADLGDLLIHSSTAKSAVDASTGVSMTFSEALINNNSFSEGGFIVGSENAGPAYSDENRLIFDNITVMSNTVVKDPDSDFTGISIENTMLAAKSSDTIDLTVADVKVEGGHSNKVVGIRLDNNSLENKTKLDLTVSSIYNDKNAITSDIIGADVAGSISSAYISSLQTNGGDVTGVLAHGCSVSDYIKVSNLSTSGSGTAIGIDVNRSGLGTSIVEITDITGGDEAWGLRGDGTSVWADKITVDKIQSDGNSIGIEIHQLSTNSSRYDNLTATNIQGNMATGIIVKGTSPAGGGESKEERLLWKVNKIHAIEGNATGIEIEGIEYWHLSGIALLALNVESDKANAVGVRLAPADNVFFDEIYVDTIKGASSAIGLDLASSFSYWGHLTRDKLITINNIQSEGRAEGLRMMGDDRELRAENLSITGVHGTYYSSALTVVGSTVNANNAIINVTPSDEYKYDGYFKEQPHSSGFDVHQFAIRQASGSHVNFENGDFIIKGSILVDAWDQSNGTTKETKFLLNSPQTTQVFGDVFAINGGVVEIALQNEDSAIDGQIDDYSVLNMDRPAKIINISGLFWERIETPGEVQLSLLNGSTWTARGRNVMTSLNFGKGKAAGGGGTVDLSQTPNGSLTVANLHGNGSFKMGFSPYDKDTHTIANGNMLYVTQTFDKNSTQNIEIIAHNDLSSIDQLDGMRFATTVGDAGDAKSFKVTMKDQGFFNRDFEVKTEKYDPNDEKNIVFNGEGWGYGSYKPGEDTVNEMFANKDATNWYIDLGGDETTDPDEPNKPGVDLSDAGQALMATLRSTYWNAISMDRLNQRLGDARYAHGTDGLWVRVKHDQFGTDTGVGDFKSKGQTYKLGYDHAFVKDGGRLLTGVAVDYMTADIDYRGVHGQGTMDRIAGTAYATWLSDDGFYVDATAKYGVLSNSFDIYTASGTVVNSEHENHVLGASLEVGKKLTNPNGMFLEPQLQMQYSHVTSSNFGTSQATSIYQGSIDSIVTRMGIRLGCMLGEDQRSNVYWKADVLKEWAGKQTVKVHDVTTTANGVKFNVENDHAWFDIGAGFQYNLTKDIHAYADVEYRFGNEVDKSWTVNGGARWQF